MRNAVFFVLKVSLLFTSLYGNSQQPVLSVQNFEYIWEKTEGAKLYPGKSRIILASEDSARRAMKNAFALALQNRWNIEMPESPLSVKPLGLFSNTPKFNTRLKEKQAGVWYLFLQIFDTRPMSFVSAENTDRRVSVLELKCRLIDSYRDSVILDRNLVVEIYEQPAPPDQVVLFRLPGYPGYYIRAYDSIAKWLFQPEDPGQKKIRLMPACVYTGLSQPTGSISELLFNSNNDTIHHFTQPSFLFKRSGPGYKKTDGRRNRGGNTATGALTLFTGINLNKSRVFEYSADFTFEEGDSIYHCVINYAERETADRKREKTTNSDGSKSYSVESGSYELLERRTDSTFINAITIGSDTLATFRILNLSKSKERTRYTQFWDGRDSATIAPLPGEWNNSAEEDNVTISGQMGSHLFSMKTVKGMNVKEFYISDRLVMIMYGQTTPAKALLFHPFSTLQLKIFTILASLPYPHFNYSAY